MAEDVCDLVRRQRRVHGDARRAHAHQRVIRERPFEPVLRHDRDPVVASDARVDEGVREGMHVREHFPVRDRAPPIPAPAQERIRLVELVDRTEEQLDERAFGQLRVVRGVVPVGRRRRARGVRHRRAACARLTRAGHAHANSTSQESARSARSVCSTLQYRSCESRTARRTFSRSPSATPPAR